MENSDNIQTYQWMADAPDIDNLSLFEMTLPGAHNAGCDWDASYALIPGKTGLPVRTFPFIRN